ncbi:MAG: glycoside hydrolase family 28 protein [Anaerolineales bacterium]
MTTYNPLNFGALGDGRADDTAAVQAAIEACSAGGGGRVLLTGGKTFRAGSLVMKSNVELHLEAGAVLQASPNPADYPQKLQAGALTGGAVDETHPGEILFITAEGAHNIAFTGLGVIDGGGRFFVQEDLGYIYKMKPRRPFTFCLFGCHNVTLRDLTIRDGALWTVRLSGCDDILIDGIRIENDLKLPNSDGIDLDRCRNARISNCHIVSGDDCIVLKTCQETAAWGDTCENIVVSNCTLMSTSIALCVGVECRAPMRDILFDSCVIKSSHRGVAVRLGEGSDVENVIFSNIVIETRRFHPAWWGSGEPICVSAVPWDSERGIGRVRNIRFLNLLCRGENGVYLEGWTPDRVQDILFENVRLELARHTQWPGARYDRRPCPTEWWQDPEQGFRLQPTDGFCLINAQNVTLRNCAVRWGENPAEEYRHALSSRGVNGLELENFQGQAAFPLKYESISIED